MNILGLTGSIATGKSFVANIFKHRGIKIFSSDFEVGLSLKELEVIEKIRNYPELSCAVNNNEIDKSKLSHIVFKDIKALKILEEILHPLIERKMQDFISNNKQEKTILLEIPLLFERGHQSYCDKVITTYCSIKTQTERALRRTNIDINRLNFIKKQQIQGKIKAVLTDYLVYTDISYDFTNEQLKQIFVREGLE